MRLNIAIRLIVYCILWSDVQAQQAPHGPYPEVGQTIPNFVLLNIHHFSKASITVSDLKGKWTILYFWTKECPGCIASMPMMSEVAKKYRSNVTFMFIGKQDSEKQIENLFENERKQNNLDFPCAFDSSIFNRFNIGPCPFIVVLDPKGVVQAVTMAIGDYAIDQFLIGNHPRLTKASRKDEPGPKFDPTQPFLLYGNGGEDNDFDYRAVLSRWNSTMYPGSIFYTMKEYKKQFKRVDVVKVPLKRLFNLAYIGKIAWNPILDTDRYYGRYAYNPILQVRDSSLFRDDFENGANYFCYSLSVPPEKATVEEFERLMRSDLQNYFSMTATVQTRDLPCWELVCLSDTIKAKLMNRGAPKVLKATTSGLKMTDQTIKYIIGEIWGFHQFDDPVIDETGITTPIDIDLKCNMASMEQIRNALQKEGLDLKRSVRPMKVVVITDSDPD